MQSAGALFLLPFLSEPIVWALCDDLVLTSEEFEVRPKCGYLRSVFYCLSVMTNLTAVLVMAITCSDSAYSNQIMIVIAFGASVMWATFGTNMLRVILNCYLPTRGFGWIKAQKAKQIL